MPSASRRNPRDPLTMVIRYRGGPESWWSIETRGRVWRRPGYICLDDVMSDILQGVGGKQPDVRYPTRKKPTAP